MAYQYLYIMMSHLNKLIIPMFRLPYKFQTDKLESEFLADYANRFANSRRAAILLGISVWTSYIGWDVYHGIHSDTFRPSLDTILFLRIVGVVDLIIVATAIFRMKTHVEKSVTLILSSGVLIIYVLLLLMIIASPFPYNYLFYFIGLPLVLIFIYSLLRLLARPIFMLTALMILASCIALRYAVRTDGIREINALDSYYYVAAMTYLLSFAIVGVAVCIELERSARKAFSRESKLQSTSATLEQKNKQLQELDLETQAKTKALVDLKDQLRTLAEQRAAAASKFLADAAHDLRQPIHAMGNLLAAAHHAIDQGDLRKCAEFISLAETAARTTGASFNSILDISGLESGFVKATYEHFDIQSLLDDILTTFLVIGREQNVDVRIRKSEKGSIIVRSDYQLLGRALANIISNAIKYRATDGSRRPTMILGVVCFSTRIRLDVVDNGIGIPGAQWRNIFKPFVQLDNPNKDQAKGRGLGLSIVDAVVRLLDGHRVEMTSIVGKGTRFSISIPLSDGPLARQHASDDMTLCDGFDLSEFYILYVEDDTLVAASMKALLEMRLAKFDFFDSFEALDAAIDEIGRIPDLIISDYRLPNSKNAFDVVERVNAEFEVNIPLLVITAEIDIENTAGAYPNMRRLAKPASPTRVLLEIQAMLQDA